LVLHLKALGIATGAYELALKYSQERKAFGEIFKHQAIAFKLADGDSNHGR
jgi:alkylation response protein AidB-like acyl-CoA dehydrogenase